MQRPLPLLSVSVFAVLTGVVTGVTIASRELWLPLIQVKSSPSETLEKQEHAGHHHGGEDEHGEAGDLESLALSEQARANLGLKLGEVVLSTFAKSIVIPGVVVEEPGHSERRVTTSLSGVVVKVHAFPGQAVKPGDPLLDIQPTGELMTNAQAALLKSLLDIELLDIELKRLAPLVENGTIPARNKLEKEYERKRLDAQKLVQIQELLVRGLTPDQITELAAHRNLLREFTIYVPGGAPKLSEKGDDHNHPSIVPTSMTDSPESSPSEDHEMVFTIENIDVFPGKLIQPGDELCALGLHTDLYLEGHAFERDSALIAQAIQEQRELTALFEMEADPLEKREGLRIRYTENSLDPTTRILRFYVPLKNEILREAQSENGVVYRSWRFKPGQKVRLLVPMQQLTDQIVVPADAVVVEGPEAFVFRSNGQLMERVPVVVDDRDPRSVVIRNDGTLFPGDEIAMNQAYQLHLALKKQQGSGVDLHAGHSH